MSFVPAPAAKTAPEVIAVPADTHEVRCTGGHPSLGHPAVFFTLEDKQSVTCGYCDRVFVKA